MLWGGRSQSEGSQSEGSPAAVGQRLTAGKVAG